MQAVQTQGQGALPAVRLQAVEPTVMRVLMLYGEQKKDGPITQGLGLPPVPFGDTFFPAQLF